MFFPRILGVPIMFRKIIFASCATLMFLLASTATSTGATSKNELVFVASKKGILAYRMNLSTGAMTDLGVAGEIANPGFLALHPSGRFLYSVSSAKIAGQNVGLVSAFSLDRKKGKLALVNQRQSGGANPTHLAVDNSGRNLLVANYGSGSVEAFPIRKDGSLDAASGFMQHRGSSIDPRRQEGPHAHSISTDPANRFVLSCDLGMDQILVYKFDSAKGSLTANDPPFGSVKPGAGPRHHAFHPSGKFLYVINELDSTMTAFAYDAKRGALREVQTLSTLPKDFSGKSYPAEVAVHPSGKFLYGSNRGHDSIVVFGINKKTGCLHVIEHQSTAGKNPRHFEIDPTGHFLLAANQDSGTVVNFRIDPKTGMLTPLGVQIEAEVPMCVKALPP